MKHKTRILLMSLTFLWVSFGGLQSQNRGIIDGETIEESKGKIALLIGNAKYEGKNTLCLDRKNCPPENDVDALGEELRTLTFKTIVKKNLDRKGMEEALDEFHEEIESGNYDLALFHFSGHGSQVKGVNYLYPIGGKPKIANDAADELISINKVVGRLDNPNISKRVIILDACRNNPFEKAWSRSSAQAGLADVELPDNTYLAMAAAPGQVAANISVSGKYGLFTEVILQHIGTRDMSVADVFGRVSKQVSSTADGLGVVQKPHRAATGDIIYLNSDINWNPRDNTPNNTSMDTTIILELGGIATSVGLGGGLLISGLSKMSKAKDKYNNTYTQIRDPNNNAYSEFNGDRTAYYEAIDKDHKQGSTLAIIGSVVAIGGGLYFVNRFLEKRKRRVGNKTSFIFLPEVQETVTTSIGLKMVYNF